MEDEKETTNTITIGIIFPAPRARGGAAPDAECRVVYPLDLG